MVAASPAIEIASLSHRYGDRLALDSVSLTVQRSEIFAFLGPNGGGKTTLFRVLSTLVRPQSGDVRLLGFDVRQSAYEVRRRIGVVFQSPSLDKKLSVKENLWHQGVLYGLDRTRLASRSSQSLELLGLTDRAKDRVESLSGGLRRRVELAKGLLHDPQILLLDEPSTGLDPGARREFWRHLETLRDERGITVLLTTHLLDEADQADRIAILDRGRVVAEGSPDALKATVSGDAITIESDEPHAISEAVRRQFELDTRVLENAAGNGAVRIEVADGHAWVPRLVEAFPGRIRAITLGKPTLEDVFIARCGRRME
jgi:ABC-2 type transport system ATP-binding protein